MDRVRAEIAARVAAVGRLDIPPKAREMAEKLSTKGLRQWLHCLEEEEKEEGKEEVVKDDFQERMTFESPPVRRSRRKETLRVEFPLLFTVFGSPDSLDIDVVLWVPRPIWEEFEIHDRKNLALDRSAHSAVVRSLSKTGRLGFGREVDVNPACADSEGSGMIVGTCKGDCTETAAAVLATAELHFQPCSECPLRTPSRLNVGHKTLRVARTILSMSTERTSRIGRRVRRVLGLQAKLGEMLDLLEELDLAEICWERSCASAKAGDTQVASNVVGLERLLRAAPTTGDASTAVDLDWLHDWEAQLKSGHWNWEEFVRERDRSADDLPKKLAYYLASGLGMLRGAPLFTKTAVCETYPRVAPLVTRKPFSQKDLGELEILKTTFLAEARRVLQSDLDKDQAFFETLPIVPVESPMMMSARPASKTVAPVPPPAEVTVARQLQALSRLHTLHERVGWLRSTEFRRSSGISPAGPISPGCGSNFDAVDVRPLAQELAPHIPDAVLESTKQLIRERAPGCHLSNLYLWGSRWFFRHSHAAAEHDESAQFSTCSPPSFPILPCASNRIHRSMSARRL
jgi:hypothetical protein